MYRPNNRFLVAVVVGICAALVVLFALFRTHGSVEYLRDSAAYGDMFGVKLALALGASPDDTPARRSAPDLSPYPSGGTGGRSPLTAAVRFGHEDIVRLLLQHGANPNARDDRGDTALEASEGSPGIVRLLLRSGADPDEVRMSPGNEAIVRALWDVGAKRDLTSAALLGEVRAAHTLLRTKDLNRRALTSTLEVAIAAGNSDIARLLLAKGADARAGCLLCDAAERGSEQTVDLLLEFGAEPDQEDTLGETALVKAARSGYEEVARTLLEHGADPYARDNMDEDITEYRHFTELILEYRDRRRSKGS
jgi:hypothetical protein